MKLLFAFSRILLFQIIILISETPAPTSRTMLSSSTAPSIFFFLVSHWSSSTSPSWGKNWRIQCFLFISKYLQKNLDSRCWDWDLPQQSRGERNTNLSEQHQAGKICFRHIFFCCGEWWWRIIILFVYWLGSHQKKRCDDVSGWCLHLCYHRVVSLNQTGSKHLGAGPETHSEGGGMCNI